MKEYIYVYENIKEENHVLFPAYLAGSADFKFVHSPQLWRMATKL